MMRVMYDPINSTTFGFDDSIVADMCYSKGEIDDKISTVFRLCGKKTKVSDLPDTGTVGDVWIISSTNEEWVWTTSGEWEDLGPVVDVNKKYVDDLIGTLPQGYSNVTAYILAAKQAGDNAEAHLTEHKQAYEQFKAAQLVFESTQADIAQLVEGTTKIETSDTVFSRRKTYYKLVGGEYVALVMGTDYEATDPVADFGATVYEARGFTYTELIAKVNELVTAGNALIAAHKQAAAANNQGGE